MIKSHSEFRKGKGLTEALFTSSLEVGDKSGTRGERVWGGTQAMKHCTSLCFPQKLKMLCKDYSCQ